MYALFISLRLISADITSGFAHHAFTWLENFLFITRIIQLILFRLYKIILSSSSFSNNSTETILDLLSQKQRPSREIRRSFR